MNTSFRLMSISKYTKRLAVDRFGSLKASERCAGYITGAYNPNSGRVLITKRKETNSGILLKDVLSARRRRNIEVFGLRG